MLTRLSLTARIGLALLLVPLAVLGGWAAWYFTRSWEPLNAPISLARGHIRAEFDVNVPSAYAMELDLSQDRVLQRHPCPNDSMACDSTSFAGVRWSVSSHGKQFAAGTGKPAPGDLWVCRSIGTFQCGKGHYVLNMDVLEDQSRLNFYEPRLVVYESGGKAASDPSLWVGALSLVALVFGGPVGISMIVLAVIGWRQRKLFALWKTYPLNQPGNSAPGLLRLAFSTGPLRLRRPVSASMRPFSGVFTQCLLPLLMLCSLVMALAQDWSVPVGLPLRIVRPGVHVPSPPGIQPVLVRVAKNSQVYIGSELTSRENLSTRLKQELSHRPPDWPVYVEADPDLDWAQVAKVIDEIRGIGADVILVPREPQPKGGP